MPLFYKCGAPFRADGEQIGIVAQELERTALYMVSQVSYKDIPDLREVNNQAYVFLLINAVKEQQQMIDEPKRANDMQQRQINELQARK